jgi:hypothetical protein
MDEKLILKYIEKDDLNEMLQFYSDCTDLDTVKSLIVSLGGFRLDVPKIENFRMLALKRHIQANDINNLNEFWLTRKFGLTRESYKKILKEVIEENKQK